LFSSKDFWSIWVDNKFAPAGLCGLKLHHGEQLLLAAVPDTSNGFPLVLSAPSRATIGHPFQVTGTYFGQTGKKTPLAHARVTGRGISATTNAHGVATIGASKAGTLVLKASAPGYVRSAPDRVRVS
jgi:hypothetical protein